MRIVKALLDDPAQSFPHAVKGKDADLQALYRFFANDKVTMELALEPHLTGMLAASGARQRMLCGPWQQ